MEGGRGVQSVQLVNETTDRQGGERQCVAIDTWEGGRDGRDGDMGCDASGSSFIEDHCPA